MSDDCSGWLVIDGRAAGAVYRTGWLLWCMDASTAAASRSVSQRNNDPNGKC